MLEKENAQKPAGFWRAKNPRKLHILKNVQFLGRRKWDIF
jgi:hypothetical protein